MGKQADVYAALDASTSALATALGMARAFPNADFTPGYGSDGIIPYLRVDLFNNAPFWAGMRAGRLDQGMIQITPTFPRAHDLAAARLVIDSIIAAYPRGGYLAAVTKVKIQSATYASSPIPEPDRVTYPITVSWVA